MAKRVWFESFSFISFSLPIRSFFTQPFLCSHGPNFVSSCRRKRHPNIIAFILWNISYVRATRETIHWYMNRLNNMSETKNGKWAAPTKILGRRKGVTRHFLFSHIFLFQINSFFDGGNSQCCPSTNTLSLKTYAHIQPHYCSCFSTTAIRAEERAGESNEYSCLCRSYGSCIPAPKYVDMWYIYVDGWAYVDVPMPITQVLGEPNTVQAAKSELTDH